MTDRPDLPGVVASRVPESDGTPYRRPAEESHLYPGLCLADNRVTGSITVGCSRLPLWAFAGWDWDEVVHGWDYIEKDYGWTHAKQAGFLHDLLQNRGEFGRLLLLLADAERCEHARGGWNKPWWETKRHPKRVAAQLRRCLEGLS